MTRAQTLLMLLLAAIWGGSYALIRVALDGGIPWAWVAFLRIGLGAVVMVVIALRTVGARALLARPGWMAAVGAAQIGVPFLLIPWGERHVPSGLTGVLIGTAPLFTVLLAQRFVPDTALGRGGLIGVVVGFVGVVLLFAADLSASGDQMVGGLAVVLAAVFYGIGSTLSRRRLQGVPPIAVATGSLAWAALLTLVAAVLFVPAPPVPGSATILALVVLGAVGTGIAYLIFFTLVSEVGPSRAMLVTYLAPVFALVYGTVFFDETVTIAAIAGIVLIVGGSAVGGSGGVARVTAAVRGRRATP